MKNIVLIGFMGTGKSTVGKILAKALGYEFVDSDAEIEKNEGMPIKEIFSRYGESHFRQLESNVISELAAGRRCVIATGGGVVLSKSNIDALKRNGTIICLKASLEAILTRAGKTGSRPLLNGDDPLQAINRLLESRQGLYTGEFCIDTTHMSPDAVSLRIIEYLNSEKHSSSFTLEFNDSVCEIISGSKLLEDLTKYISAVYPSGKILAVSNPTVHSLWGSKLQSALGKDYAFDWCLIPDGEEYKNIDSLTKLYDKAAQMKLTRDSLMIGFGGGVVGDLTGFAAATYMRGIPYVHIPTTLLSQTDSSIGGKTAINHKEGKNLIGSFYQPLMVIADTTLLLTLPDREFKSGLAEVIKYGVIQDYELFEYLESHMNEILKMEQKALCHIISRSCRIKASIVQQDEKDQGIRMLLNYGHTIGHAIEAATGYNTFLHGEAVALGMAAASFMAESMGLIKEADRIRQNKLLEAAGLPISLPCMDTNKVLDHMQNDKKAQQEQLRFALPAALGSASVFGNISEECIRNALEHIKGIC